MLVDVSWFFILWGVWLFMVVWMVNDDCVVVYVCVGFGIMVILCSFVVVGIVMLVLVGFDVICMIGVLVDLGVVLWLVDSESCCVFIDVICV